MSSSQQQPTNPNNNNNINQAQIQNNPVYDDYAEYVTGPPYNNSNINPQAPYVIGNDYVYAANPAYINNYVDDDDDIPSDLENELNAVEMMRDEQINSNYEDESIYSDAVQNAFAKYENEYSQYWNSNKPVDSWENFTDAEQEEMIDQMRECMMFMTQDYAAAGMPSDLIDQTQGSRLNPDAVEFRPSWSIASESLAVPVEVKKQNEGEE